MKNLVGDKRLPKDAVKIFDGQTEIQSFFSKGIPNIECLAMPIGSPEENMFFGLKMDTFNIKTGQEIYLETEINLDIRVEMVVSVLKAAHLSLFYQLGYEYAYRSSGRFMGALLAEFYEANRNKKKSEIREESLNYFRPYVNMVRPITHITFEADGTASDGHTFLVKSSSGGFWAMMVLVKTPGTMHAVLVPTAETAEDVGTFWNFLSSDQCNLHVNYAAFRKDEQKWEVSTKASPFFWKKKNVHLDPMPSSP
ncbi:hypothetical protein B1R32_1417 [Abditibacterium utsteinense]|uniref:Uncharacterized protein n=1 Tax=Abditibacterium utsteinense TaxID=1960156 RepID=A0A2S8SNN1_9BACT|nr:hypothetical protein [Abditibacterium utsteinense]PQV62397.1 hypothetical protein B1R32_1417 [Abditibacterium utsteinense]